MQRIKVYLGAALAVLLWTGSASYSAPPATIKVGLYQNNPKIFSDDRGKPAGIFVDIINEIARREGWEVRFVAGTWDECLGKLADGTIDLMPDMAFSDERNRLYDFNQESVLSSWSQVYSGKGQDIRSILDLNGKRIAVLDQSIQHADMNKLARQFGISYKLSKYPSFDEAFHALEGGHVDAAITNRFFGIANKGKYGVKETSVIFDPASLHFAAKKGANQDILAGIDRDLKALKGDKASAYYRILDNWLDIKRPTRMPVYLLWAAFSVLALLVVSLTFTGILKWQLRLKSEELINKNKALVGALKDLEKAQAEALRTEKLNVLGQMASGVAHDFNNVLVPIIGYTELLLLDDKSLGNIPRLRHLLGIIGSAAKDGEDIVKRMRDFYNESGGNKRETLEIPEILDYVETLCKLRFEGNDVRRGISIKRIADKVPPIYANQGEMREAFMNILLNAVEAMPKGGTIDIECYADHGKVVTTIKDPGTGMDKTTRQNCLQPFFTTKGNAGTGMGLTITAGIIERHGGTLEIRSEPDKGTRVSIILPQAQTGLTPEEEQSRKYSIKPIRILVLDDDRRALDSLAAQLSVDGHYIEALTDPVQALSRAANGHFDLIITDHLMPGLNGDMLALAIKQVAPRSVIIMVTGGDEVATGIFGRGEYIKKILVKPVRLNTLRDALVELGFGSYQR